MIHQKLILFIEQERRNKTWNLLFLLENEKKMPQFLKHFLKA